MQAQASASRKISPKTPVDKIGFTHDLVDIMEFLFVRVVKAKDLEGKDVTHGLCDPYVKVKLGNFKGKTIYHKNNPNPEWNKVFAFAGDQMQASQVEVVVKDKNLLTNSSIGRVKFDLIEVPRCVPPDSPLAPQWYHLEDKKGYKLKKGLIMLAVWKGTQADEAFSDAWHSGAVTLQNEEALLRIRGKVYVAPKLWYLRVKVIACQDLVTLEKNKMPLSCVRVILGNQMLKTQVSKGSNPVWDEDNLIFVVAEPFEESLVFIVEDRVLPNKDDILAKCVIPVKTIVRRNDEKNVPPKWYSLERPGLADEIDKKMNKFASRIHLRMTLEGGCHVMDEPSYYLSDPRPSARALWKDPIGLLELGIIKATGLPEMRSHKDGKACADAFCVAKYGPKWVRTRTVICNCSPKWNEQYTWEVYDPCTVITIAVFNNGHVHGEGRDLIIGKVRIRLSTLVTDRVYTLPYPLIVLSPSGPTKMGELELAVRFTCTSFVNMMQKYMQPLLPKMHYVVDYFNLQGQRRMLKAQAISIITNRFGQAEPPLKKDVVDYILDTKPSSWSLRKANANVQRIRVAVSILSSIWIWLSDICKWKNPITTILVHILFLILVLNPELILPTLFFYLFITVVWRFRFRPKGLAHMDVQFSQAHLPYEHDEEFDTYPTSKSSELVRRRYDYLRSIAGKVQTTAGEFANQLERFHSLISWRDPRASAMFAIFCFLTAILFYVVPFRALVLLGGFYIMRHPKFHHKYPSFPNNFFKRLPSKEDYLM